MKAKVLPDATPKTDAEYQQEADRLLGEIRQMLDNARRSSEESRRIGRENQQSRQELRKRLLCGKD